MKGRDSGMPVEEYWNSFFDADCVIKALFGEEGCCGNVVEFGCGYGTFTFLAARYTTGTVHAFDIEPTFQRPAVLRWKSGLLQNNAEPGLRLQGSGIRCN